MAFEITTELTDDLWQQGTVGPGGYRYEAKVYGASSEWGIDGGTVSKLRVFDRDRDEVAHFDRGWELKPKPQSFAAFVVNDIVEFYRAREKDMPVAVEREPAADNSRPFVQKKRYPATHESQPPPGRDTGPTTFLQKDKRPDVAEARRADPAEARATDNGPQKPRGSNHTADEKTRPAHRSEDNATAHKITALVAGYPRYFGEVEPGTYSFQANVYSESLSHESRGVVTDLIVWDRQEEVARYEGGWVLEPKQGSAHAAIVKEIVGFFRDRESELSQDVGVELEDRRAAVKRERQKWAQRTREPHVAAPMPNNSQRVVVERPTLPARQPQPQPLPENPMRFFANNRDDRDARLAAAREALKGKDSGKGHHDREDSGHEL